MIQFKKRKQTFLLICGLWIAMISSGNLLAQTNELKLAGQYVLQGEKDKALSLYRELHKKTPSDPQILDPYLRLLNQQELYEEGFGVVNKFNKKKDPAIKFLVFEYLFSKKYLSENQFKKYKTKFYSRFSVNDDQIVLVAEEMKREVMINDAVDLLLYARSVSSSTGSYAFELAQLYAILSNTGQMFKEYLFLLETYQMSKEELQNFIQGDITNDSAFDIVENQLIDRSQANPEFLAYTEMLNWLYIQKKEFSKALIYAKAIDVRAKKKGTGLFELALLAYNNGFLTEAKEICKHIVTHYPSGNIFFQAKRLSLSVSEKLLKEKYPVSQPEVRQLISEFESYKRVASEYVPAFDINLSIARLYAFYLQEFDTAIYILTALAQESKAGAFVQSEAKLDLGDIYLLVKRPWEASLTYSQVEKSMKDQPLGYEAKYRNARLSYFKGEFLLAQSHLDILKLATTREIANNAIQLSLLIKDNLEADSTEEALSLYASIEQLEFINKLDEAVDGLKKLLSEYPNHPLTDDANFKLALILRKLGRSHEAIAHIDALLSKEPDAILADDALFLKATIQEVDLHEPKSAMDSYYLFLTEYQGSTLVNEARKKYRQLRGDKIN